MYQVAEGTQQDIDSWMELVKRVRWNFPGLETENGLKEHRDTVLEFMQQKRAICAKDGNRIIGVLLFSRKYNMKIKPWNIANTTVKILVYCDNFLLPASPSSFCSFSKEGITTETNCIMIDAVMKGPIPSANTDTAPKAPPENKSRKPMILLPCAMFAKTWLLIPNKGNCAPSLNAAIIRNVNRIFCLSPEACHIDIKSSVEGILIPCAIILTQPFRLRLQFFLLLMV